MNTNELRCILTRDPKTRQQLVDVFALDEFKQYVKRIGLFNGIYVCNDQVAEKAGNHWFLIYVEDNIVNFVDSFAKEPSFYGISTELETKVIKVLPFQLQSFFSDVCGEYTLFFSYHLCRNYKLEQIYRLFSKTNVFKNDERVQNFVHRKFPGHKRI